MRTRWILLIVLISALGIGGFLGFKKVKSYVWHARQNKLVAQAGAFYQDKKFTEASLSAQRALEINPNNAEATRILGLIADYANDPDALRWHQKVAQFFPDNPTNWANLAYLAIRYQDLDAAEEALAKYPQNATNTALFHSLAGALSIQKKDLAKADTHFSFLVNSDPENEAFRLGRAKIRINSTDPQVKQSSLQEISSVFSNPTSTNRVDAASTLCTYYNSADDPAQALPYAEFLLKESTADFPNLIRALSIVYKVKPEDFLPHLAQLKSLAESNPDSIRAMVEWLNSNQMAHEVVRWISTLPKENLNPPFLRIAVSNAYVILGNWTDLISWTEEQPWGDWDFLRFAMQAVGKNGGPKPILSREASDLWQVAIDKARLSPSKLQILANYASQWRWYEASEKAWWTLAQGNYNQSVALNVLSGYYRQKKDLFGLYRVAQRNLELNPNEPTVQIEYCSYAQLLNRDEDRVNKLCDDLRPQVGTNAFWASTLALSLSQRGRHQEALNLLSSMAPESIQHPNILPYKGILLARAGDIQQAENILAQISIDQYFPEEQKLIQSTLLNIQAFQQRKQDYLQTPGDITRLCRYAFSLFQLGKTDEARQLLQSVQPAQPTPPIFAATYGIIFGDSRDPKTHWASFAAAKNTPQVYSILKDLYAEAPNLPVISSALARLGFLLKQDIEINSRLVPEGTDNELLSPDQTLAKAMQIYLKATTAEASQFLNSISSANQSEAFNQLLRFYQGIFDAMNDQFADAAPLLENIPSNLLLPEEEILLSQAHAKLNQFLTLKSNYTQSPQDPTQACLYAYALFRQSHSDEAQKILDTLQPPAANHSLVHTLRGLILTQKNQWDNARKSFLLNSSYSALYDSLKTYLDQSEDPQALIQFHLAAHFLKRSSLDLFQRTQRLATGANRDTPAFTLAYSMGLFRHRQTDNALLLLSKLSEEQLGNSPMGLYYGLMLADEKQFARAKPYLEKYASQAGFLEEKEWLTSAQQALKAFESNNL